MDVSKCSNYSSGIFKSRKLYILYIETESVGTDIKMLTAGIPRFELYLVN